MNDRLQISFSDAVVLILIFLFLTAQIEWSYWYLTGLLFWYRFHVIRRRAWHSIKTTAKNGEIARKIRKEQKAAAGILLILTLTGCAKDWKCTTTTTMYGGTGTTTFTFEGTREEMEKYEQDNTHHSEFFTQTTDCK